MSLHRAEPEFPFTEDEFKERIHESSLRVLRYISAYSSIISQNIDGIPTLIGNGTYIGSGSKIFILTAEHVANRMANCRVFHKPLAASQAFPILENGYRFPEPYDLSLLPVHGGHWITANHYGDTIKHNQIEEIAGNHSREIYAFAGFSQKRSKPLFGELAANIDISLATLMKPPLDPRVHEGFHLCVEYKPDLATNYPATSLLPTPEGFSGCALWNTQIVAAGISGLNWHPGMMRITGVIWYWSTVSGCVVATRSQHVRSFLYSALAEYRTNKVRGTYCII